MAMMKLDQSQQMKIRNLVAGVYDIQKLRIATGNRIVQSFNIQMGQAPSTKQEDMDKEAQKLIEQLRSEYKLVTDAYINKQYYKDKDGKLRSSGDGTTIKSAKSKETPEVEMTVIKVKPNESVKKIIDSMNTDGDGLKNIKSETDYKLIKSYMELCESEELTLSTLEKEVKQHPLWSAFFEGVKGCGPLMAAVCIAYFDIDKARHVSSFWKYCGLDTVTYTNEAGELVTEGRSRKHAKFTTVRYEDKNGEIKEKVGLGYNPILKTKLVGVLADCMIKAGLRVAKDENGEPILDSNGKKIQTVVAGAKYVQIYMDYRNRLNQRPDMKDVVEVRKHNMAKRYMIKMFIRDLWVTWREMAGYEVSEPYEVAKLGMKPHKYNEAQCESHERTKK